MGAYTRNCGENARTVDFRRSQKTLYEDGVFERSMSRMVA
jgi:hypothetical protein